MMTTMMTQQQHTNLNEDCLLKLSIHSIIQNGTTTLDKDKSGKRQFFIQKKEKNPTKNFFSYSTTIEQHKNTEKNK